MKKKILLLVAKFGGELISEDLCRTFRFKTIFGDLDVTFFDDNYTFIPMMFRENFDLSKFLELTNDETINRHSFKWNLHSSDKKFNLDRLEARLDFITKN